MVERADGAGDPAIACHEQAENPDTIEMGRRLAAMLGRQIEMLEAEPDDGVFSEARVKSLLSLTKAVQAMEMAGRLAVLTERRQMKFRVSTTGRHSAVLRRIGPCWTRSPI